MAARSRPRTADTHQRHCENLARLSEARQFDVLMVGDSNFERMSKTPEFREFAERHRVFCAGVGGDRVCNMLWRVQEGQLQQVIQPKIVVLMAGTNDVEQAHDAAGMARNIQGLVWEIKERFGWDQTRVVLMGILPRLSENVEEQILNVKIRKTNVLLAKADYVETFEDFGSQFSENDFTIRRDMFLEDGVHLNEEGYRHFLFGLDAVLTDVASRPPKKTRRRR